MSFCRTLCSSSAVRIPSSSLFWPRWLPETHGGKSSHYWTELSSWTTLAQGPPQLAADAIFGSGSPWLCAGTFSHAGNGVNLSFSPLRITLGKDPKPSLHHLSPVLEDEQLLCCPYCNQNQLSSLWEVKISDEIQIVPGDPLHNHILLICGIALYC